MISSLFAPGPERDAWVSTTIALGVLGLGLVFGARVRRVPARKELAYSLFRRRPLASIVLGLYVLVGLLDSITWVGAGGAPSGTDRVLAYEAQSLVDRVLRKDHERGYSAPLAKHEFYEGTPLADSHLLGTNVLGQDVLYLTLKGTRVALLIGGLTSLITIPLALFFGVIAGYFGGRVDDVVFFVMSTLASMPGILLLVALVMVLGQGTLSVCIALGITSWVGFARLARGETLKLRKLDYVLAARSLGVGPARILVRHILPNLMHLVIVTFVLLFSGLVLSEATLSWLGIGVSGSWGQMIAQAKDELSRDPIIWWNVLPAGVALFVLLLCVNLIGDALRDVLDPRTQRERS
jgi:peptide/nickel transport system permease protein